MPSEILRDILNRLRRVEGVGHRQPAIYPGPDELSSSEAMRDWLVTTREAYVEMLWGVLESLEEVVGHYEGEARQSPSQETSP